MPCNEAGHSSIDLQQFGSQSCQISVAGVEYGNLIARKPLSYFTQVGGGFPTIQPDVDIALVEVNVDVHRESPPFPVLIIARRRVHYSIISRVPAAACGHTDAR